MLKKKNVDGGKDGGYIFVKKKYSGYNVIYDWWTNSSVYVTKNKTERSIGVPTSSLDNKIIKIKYTIHEKVWSIITIIYNHHFFIGHLTMFLFFLRCLFFGCLFSALLIDEVQTKKKKLNPNLCKREGTAWLRCMDDFGRFQLDSFHKQVTI